MDSDLQKRTPGVLMPGDPVTYVDEHAHPHPALITAYHDGGQDKPGMACNLVYVSSDPGKTDGYGRQIERASSVQARNETAAHGRYYELT